MVRWELIRFGPKTRYQEQPGKLAVSNSQKAIASSSLGSPHSVNRDVPVNQESSRDSAILVGVETRKRAIRDVGLAGRDKRFEAAVNKKHAKTTDLNEKSRGRDLGFLR